MLVRIGHSRPLVCNHCSLKTVARVCESRVAQEETLKKMEAFENSAFRVTCVKILSVMLKQGGIGMARRTRLLLPSLTALACLCRPLPLVYGESRQRPHLSHEL
jgi:hypothetical protein